MFKFPACGSGEVSKDFAEVLGGVLREAGHDVRGADGTAQAEGLLAANDGEGFFRCTGTVVHPRKEVAVRIYPAWLKRAEGEAALEETPHLECWILNLECIKFADSVGYLVSFLPLVE